MYYIILEKYLKTGVVSVYNVFTSEQLAVDTMESLIEASELYGYKMDAVHTTSSGDWI